MIGSRRLVPVGRLDPGDAHDCAGITGRAVTGVSPRADPTDPNGLDVDADGIAREGDRVPRDVVPLPRS